MLHSKHELPSNLNNDDKIAPALSTKTSNPLFPNTGSLPLASFNVASFASSESVGPFGDRDQTQVFVQQTGLDACQVIVREAAMGTM